MLVREIAWRSPVAAFSPLAGAPGAVLLHAGDKAASPGWSLLAAFPTTTFEVRGRTAAIDGASSTQSPFDSLRALNENRARRRSIRRDEFVAAAGEKLTPPDFLSGLIGYVGYEMGGVLEPSAVGPPSPFALPDMAFGAYDACVLFDRASRRAFVSTLDAEAGERLQEALGAEEPPEPAPLSFSDLASNFTATGYRAAVTAALENIRDGAFFQVNLAQHLSAETTSAAPAFEIFRQLCAGDAPFAAFLQHKEGAIASNSPERFFKIELGQGGAKITAEPIKGTRPRGAHAEGDRALASTLLNDPKERAENIMIADLTRNDLSRICRDGSIAEEAICTLVSHANVHHLVSKISGALRDGLGPVDALEALFPCGSITGAPKIEAMKTIAMTEKIGRGPYCGAIGYIDDSGAADFSVAIRTMVIERKGNGARATFPVGGGITLRSDPQAEYQETLVKARGILKALSIDEGLPE